MRSKIIDSGITIGKELHDLFLKEDNKEIIENKRNQFMSIFDDLTKEFLDTLLSKDREIVEFLNVEANNCDTRAENCKTVGDLIIKNTILFTLKIFDDNVTTLKAWFYSYFRDFNLNSKKCKSHLALIEETVLELYDVKIKIQLYGYKLNNFEIYFSWQ